MTTAYGLERAGATEQNETGQAVIQETGYGGMAVWKAVAIGAFFGLEAVVPEPHSVGVPVGLATLGVGTVLYNTSVIAQLEQ